ncbi:MAG: polysaccharide deacetylase family protein [Desulfosporosinus sp.]|nr:polysaccharide deacetylase family protein [Desulfosporosinus sp.]
MLATYPTVRRISSILENKLLEIRMYEGFIICISIVFAFLFVEYGLAAVIKYFYLRRLRRSCRGKLILTYDDGPGDRLEKRLLQLLDEHDVKATFFLNAKKAEQYPKGCDLLKGDGHELAYHAYEHFHAYKKPPWIIWCEFKKTLSLLRRWVVPNNAFRPPYGKLITSILFTSKYLGINIAFWTTNSGDTYSILPDKETIIDKVLNTGGGVILMHSFDRVPENPATEDYIVELTDLLIRKAKEQMWQICTFSEMLDISVEQRI